MSVQQITFVAMLFGTWPLFKHCQSFSALQSVTISAAPPQFLFAVARHKELVRLTFDTIRERYHAMPLPSQIAKVLTAPREAILNRVCRSTPGQVHFSHAYVPAAFSR